MKIETFLFIFFGEERNDIAQEKALGRLLSSDIVVHDKLQSAHPIGVCVTIFYETTKEHLMCRPEKLAQSSIKLLKLPEKFEKELWGSNIRTFERLCERKVKELWDFGVREPGAAHEINKKLKEWGLSLGSDKLRDL